MIIINTDVREYINLFNSRQNIVSLSLEGIYFFLEIICKYCIWVVTRAYPISLYWHLIRSHLLRPFIDNSISCGLSRQISLKNRWTPQFRIQLLLSLFPLICTLLLKFVTHWKLIVIKCLFGDEGCSRSLTLQRFLLVKNLLVRNLRCLLLYKCSSLSLWRFQW